jgi:hypothetical protein
VLVGLYVDDALLFGNSSRLEKVVAKIKEQFEIKDMGLITPQAPAKFLGMEISRALKPELGIFLSQRRYAEIVLERFGMKGCTPVNSPMAPNVKLEHEGELLPEGNEYAAMVGCMLYLNKTRLDLCYALSVLSRFMSCPREPHLIAAKRVLRYIARDPGAGIFFPSTTLKKPSRPYVGVMYSDADYAGDPIMRKSTSGMIFMLCGAPILWRSKLQTIVAQSTCEAEFIAAAAAIREGLWLQKLLTDITGRRQVLQLRCDNESAIALLESTTPKVTGRTKHIDVQYWFVLDHIMKQNVQVDFVSTDLMLADCLTKPYNGVAVQLNMPRIGMRSGHVGLP